jgi:pimeloyl-ACP methyl ester carboxylesterase
MIMSRRPLIILHGWNDEGSAFDRLAGHLRQRLGTDRIHRIAIGDYLSKDDALRFDDLQAALDRAWRDHGLSREPGSADAIVHSTGGLVIRDWLDRHFAADAYPVKHLVMLAPANFGSPLAHLGRSMLGRIANGFFSRQDGQSVMETGAGILRGLELASAYSWDLAERDRFADDTGPFAPGRTLCTVLCGNIGYAGIRSMANEAGGDGTVRLSTANLNCARVDIAFREKLRDGVPVTVPKVGDYREAGGRTAFCILDGLHHSAIKLDAPLSRLGKAQRRALERIERALTLEDGEFADFCDDCDAVSEALTRQPGRRGGKPGFQNTVVRVRDQFDVAVDEYLIEFYDPRVGQKDGGTLARRMHEDVLQDVHRYGADASLRSLYLDTHGLFKAVAEANGELGMSITAEPVLEDQERARERPVGFRTLADEDIEDLCLDEAKLKTLFRPHRTLLVDVCLHRSQAANVFRLREQD